MEERLCKLLPHCYAIIAFQRSIGLGTSSTFFEVRIFCFVGEKLLIHSRLLGA